MQQTCKATNDRVSNAMLSYQTRNVRTITVAEALNGRRENSVDVASMHVRAHSETVGQKVHSLMSAPCIYYVSDVYALQMSRRYYANALGPAPFIKFLLRPDSTNSMYSVSRFRFSKV